VTIGWDIGGVNTKVARVEQDDVIAVASRAYELQRAPDALVPLLRELAAAVNASESAFRCAVTMTAELSQMFRTKRDGVTFVLDAVESAFPAAHTEVFAVDGRFLSTRAARRQPLDVAAANWAATAHVVAERYRDALVVDIGTTTTDIIPIVNGAVAATGLTDPARLASGELVYTGAVRTPVESVVTQVPYGCGCASVSAEGFAIMGDVHVWTGALPADDYMASTPDGRPSTREFAGERIARVICADREMLGEGDISQIAEAIAAAQVARIVTAIHRTITRHPSLRTAVVTGIGAFIAEQAARAVGLQVVLLSSELGDAAARCAPAAAVALLLEKTVVRA
jgi:(4-(4-[2-(gamma-L-glutamylamino)ethyl]phenoxymethyl)furan-2-yl)methanamine synthase